MANLKDKLVRPFFFIDFDDETRFRVSVTQADVDRVAKEYDGFRERVMQHPDVLSAAELKESMELVAGKKTGAAIYEAAMDYVKDGEPGITDDDCVSAVVPVFAELAGLFAEKADALRLARESKVMRYLGKDAEQPL